MGKPGWFKMPLEPAGKWLTLPALTRALGAELFRLWQDRLLEGVSAAEAEDVIVRALAPDKRERKAIRAAIRSMLDARLIVPGPGGIRLLYTAESYATYGQVDRREEGRKGDASGTQGVRKGYAKGTHQVRKGDASGTHGGQTGNGKSAESFDPVLQIDREKEEREREMGARAHVRVSARGPEPEPDYSAEHQAELFAMAFLAARNRSPYMAGHVEGFHQRVVADAEAMGRDPEELFLATLERWLAGKLNERERRAPYACFATAWGELVEQVAQPNAQTALQLAASDALRANDFDRYNELQAQLAGGAACKP